MTDSTTPEQLADDAVVIDVREQNEWDAGHAPGAIHIPLGELPERLGELPEADERDPLPIICRSGNRSGRAVAWLNQQGFDVANVEGGMKQWAFAGKPVVADSGADGQVM
ncbi:rhodanese-like domain-containing protein [Flexivirga alba]|uniref:Rhodanese-like domain-containing protein n=1 Tax=Flexivirga alba TaxID=702742 RepID=A0ABW2ADK3_9MICO